MKISEYRVSLISEQNTKMVMKSGRDYYSKVFTIQTETGDTHEINLYSENYVLTELEESDEIIL